MNQYLDQGQSHLIQLIFKSIHATNKVKCILSSRPISYKLNALQVKDGYVIKTLWKAGGKTVDSMPAGLSQLYSHMMTRIVKQEQRQR